MKNVRFDSSKAAAFLPEQALTSMEAAVTAARKTLFEKSRSPITSIRWQIYVLLMLLPAK